MKLAFTGTHSTGKTTLVKEIESSISDSVKIKCVTEVARKIICRGYPLNNLATKDSYIHYINDQLNEERDINCYDFFISDRTLLDPLAYMLANKDFPSQFIDDYFIQMMENVWLLEQSRYDIYVYFPIEFPLVLDGIRPEEEEYRAAVDHAILQTLKKHNIPYITMTGSILERKEQLMQLMNLN